jgi:hypothetical protein
MRLAERQWLSLAPEMGEQAGEHNHADHHRRAESFQASENIRARASAPKIRLRPGRPLAVARWQDETLVRNANACVPRGGPQVLSIWIIAVSKTNVSDAISVTEQAREKGSAVREWIDPASTRPGSVPP